MTRHRSIDGPECEHGHNLFNPFSCPLCARNFVMRARMRRNEHDALMLFPDDTDTGCHLGADCLCKEVHGARRNTCAHYRRTADEKEIIPS